MFTFQNYFSPNNRYNMILINQKIFTKNCTYKQKKLHITQISSLEILKQYIEYQDSNAQNQTTDIH